jgi:uncharacterized NAD-dependent epimerase/dehydratase family protein
MNTTPTAQAVLDGPAIVWCDGAFNTPNGKTAHGLVRFTRRYSVQAVIDQTYAGLDAREVLDGRPSGIPVVASLADAIQVAAERPVYFVVGLAPDGGRLPPAGRAVVREAIEHGLHIVCGLHDFLSEDREIGGDALDFGVTIHDVRKPPHRSRLHFFSGEIEQVEALKVAVLGTDSAVGKRTTAWLLVLGLEARGRRAQLVGTGQTAWLQGAKHSVVMDSLVNDFVAGELEHATVSAWREDDTPEIIVVEGQGSLMNPAYPGGLEIIAATRPDILIVQHAPMRREYDGFPGHPLHELEHQLQALTLLSGKPVLAITVNHEGLEGEAEIDAACAQLEARTGLMSLDPLVHGVDRLLDQLEDLLDGRRYDLC